MVENNNENIERIARLLSKKFKDLEQKKINKEAEHLYNLSVFLVGLAKKRVSKHTETTEKQLLGSKNTERVDY